MRDAGLSDIQIAKALDIDRSLIRKWFGKQTDWPEEATKFWADPAAYRPGGGKNGEISQGE